MDLHYLEYIIEIANMHSISRAAENLFITQSTLSQYLSRLEAELGVSLFERRRNEMTLTPAGKLYVSACEQMLQQKRELYNQLSDMGQAKTGSFSVGITPQWGAVAYSHIIGKFYESYPNVTVKVTEETASPLIRLLQDGELDMAIIPLTGNSSHSKKPCPGTPTPECGGKFSQYFHCRFEGRAHDLFPKPDHNPQA